ncbi:uncharacterized protein LOC134258762 isoform X2 [Saccostrea cucullata]|uniref:uncharacterized protein LOC134258762 isoform X2 n=1 Tax=Saccostrea cuccullata TaxID=36930 RepID=UPI002ED38A52
MERREKITCKYPNFCVTCSLFNVNNKFFATVIDIEDECTEEYENPQYEPFTYISVNGQFEEQFNQTRCCQGSRTLLYKIEEENTDALTSFPDTTTDPNTSSEETTKPPPLLVTTATVNIDTVSVVKENTSSYDTTILPTSTPFQSVDMTLLLTAGIVGVVVLFVIILLCVIVVKFKRKSKSIHGMQNLQRPVENEIYSDGVAEYSTVEETATIVKSLIHTKTRSRGSENEQQNYFILEKLEASSNACKTTYKANHNSPTEEDIYNKLHEKERQSTEVEENVYSHFSDCNENVYSGTIHR